MQRLYGNVSTATSLRAPDQGAAPDRLPGTDVVAVAHDAVFEVGAVAHARAREQDAPLDGRAGADPAVAPHGYVPRERDPAPYDRVPAHEHVALDGGGGVDLGVLPDPQALPAPLAGNAYPHLPGEHVVLGLP